MVWMSGLAYCNSAQLESWSCANCKPLFPNVDVLHILKDSKGDQGFIVADHDNKRILISFRGSSNFKNWVTNLQFWAHLVPWGTHKHAKVHSGFLNAYDNDLRGQIFPVLKAALSKYPTYRLTTTGHSLGAALAQICAVDIATVPDFNALYDYSDSADPARVVWNYGYGCPRVGNPDWAVFANQTMDISYSVVHGADLVPHLPPKILGFHATPWEIWYPNHTTNIFKFDDCNGSGEDPRCSDSVTLPSTHDHSYYLGYRINCGLEKYKP